MRPSTSTAVTALFLALPFAAGAAAAQSEDAETADVAVVDWDAAALYEMQGVRGEAMLEAEAYDETGEEVGEVEDLVLDRENRIVAVIAEVGGFLDMGDTTVAVPFDEVTLTRDGAILPLSDDNIEAYDVFGPDSYVTRDLERVRAVDEAPRTGTGTWRLTSLIDDYAVLSTGEPFGFVEDALFDTDGEMKAVLVEGTGDYGAGPYAYPFLGYDADWEPADEALILPYPEDEPFDFDAWQGVFG